MQAFEKLGLFYLGKIEEPKAAAAEESLLLYESRDLVTHAVCVGMTGSGKTGLCIGLIEEAAIDGIPAIIVDPKGDLANLMLTFPGLSPEDFRPWINEDEAHSKGISPEEQARIEAERWGKGLSDWGQDGARIQRLRDAAEFVIYTPGSTAGLPISVASSFAAPASPQMQDLELIKDRISSTASGLLGLLGIQADPLRSREHILISNILEYGWRSGKNLDLATLIQMIQSPPLQRIGVFDLESFYPAAERLQFAMMMNNLLAAPGFGTWLEGESLDIGKLLHNPEGKPRICIFSIAHLSDSERMFFVTLLLNQVLGWMRSQPGTPSLRAMLYMDEIFGFFPPVAEPPSKKPLLTLLKQARAYGLGVVLATQNPVDLDYKGLANTGTWFVGRLQTERDRDRLIEGLSSAAGGFAGGIDPSKIGELIGGLKQRSFLMQNVHEDHPVLFRSRWTLSYLAGPLTREQIKRLMEGRKPSPTALPPTTAEAPSAPAVSRTPVLMEKPQLPPEIRQLFAPVASAPSPSSQRIYHPHLFAAARFQIVNNKLGLNSLQSVSHILRLEDNMTTSPWDQTTAASIRVEELAPQGELGFTYSPPPSCATQLRWLQSAQRAYGDFVYRQSQTTLWKSGVCSVLSQPRESEQDFRVRLQQLSREKRDFDLDRLRKRYATKINSLQRQLLHAEQRIEREHEQLQGQKLQTALSIGSTLLGAFMGRKVISSGTVGRVATAGRQAARISREKQDVQRASQDQEMIRQQLQELETQIQQEADRLSSAYDPTTEPLQSIVLRPTKADIVVQVFAILWIPFEQDPLGLTKPLSST